MPKIASCILIATLLLVTIANLLLLVYILIKNVQNSSENNVDKKPPISIADYRFMCAILSLKIVDRKEFLCGGSVISKNWILTTAHCAQIVINQDLDTIKISCNSTNYQFGVLYDIERVIINEQYDPIKRLNNVAFINIRQTFKARYIAPISLPNSKFKYLANSTATILGFEDIHDKLYSFDVRLLWHKSCMNHFPYEFIGNGSLFCVVRYRNGRINNDGDDEIASCGYDASAQLIMRNSLIGIAALNRCSIDDKPEVFTKTTTLENWIRYLEKRNGILIGATFKS